MWYFRVSHSYITLDASEDPLRSVRHEILEEEQIMANHIVYVFLRCRCTMDLAQTDIDKGVFLEGSLGREIVDVILIEA